MSRFVFSTFKILLSGISVYYIEPLHLFSMEPYNLLGTINRVVFLYLKNMSVLILRIEFLELVYSLP